jgi:hypothetical protein
VSGIPVDSLVLAVIRGSPLAVLLVPIAVIMVWPEWILERWSVRNNRAYSVREMFVLETGLLAALCLFAWVLRHFDRSVNMQSAAAVLFALVATRGAIAAIRWKREKIRAIRR